MLRRSPGFTAVAVLPLALGIGGTTAVFSLVNALFFRALPVTRPDRLVRIACGSVGVSSYPDYVYYRDHTRTLASIAASVLSHVTLGQGVVPELINAQLVSANYFETLGVLPVVGKEFRSQGGEAPGSQPLAIASYSFWKSHFSERRDLMEARIELNGHSYSVIGIMPSGFRVSPLEPPVDVWVPISMQAELMPGIDLLNNSRLADMTLLGRLRPDSTAEQAETELAVLDRQLDQERPDSLRGNTVIVMTAGSLLPMIKGPAIAISSLFAIIAGLVLLIAALNVASLLLARALERPSQ
jgi:hypothetical protein